MNYLFDACALIAFLDEEKGEGYEAVIELLDRAEAGKITLYMSIVNLCEVYYGYVRNDGAEGAGRIMQNVAYLPLNIINTISETVYREVALFKGTYPLSLGDAFLCGTAKSTGAIIVTKDKEMSLCGASRSKLACRYLKRCISLIGGSFDRKFIIPSGLLPNFCWPGFVSAAASRGVLNQTFE